MLAKVDAPNSISTSWLSLLAVPGTLLLRRGEGLSTAAYVVDTTQRGVIVWNVSAKNINGQRSIKFEEQGDRPAWEFKHITELDDWACQDTVVVPPASCKELRADGTPCGIRITAPGVTITALLKFSAEHGFIKFNVSHLRKLVIFLAVPCEIIPFA